MKILAALFILVIIIFGVTFAVLNSEIVTINYYVGSHPFPLSLLLAITLFMGALLGLLISIIHTIKLKTTNYRLRQQIKIAEKEIENLRKLPMQEIH